MSSIRFRRLYPRDLVSSTVQRDLSKYTRIGKVLSVDSQAGTCTVQWYDRPGIRPDVLLTQSSPGTWEIPAKDTFCLVTFDHHERARIVRYINLGQENRVKKMYSLPKLKPGERMWEVGGSYIYMRDNGDIILATMTQGLITLENKTGTFKSESVNWKVSSEAGNMYFGVVKRVTSGSSSDGSIGLVKNKLVTDSDGQSFTELNIQVVEYADGVLGVTGIDNPLATITVGTLVDGSGNIIAKNEEITTDYNRQIALRMKFKSGVVLAIDKEGRVSWEGTSININNGSVDNDTTWSQMIADGLETQDTEKGTRGEHAAREHDEVTIPFATTYTDEEHLELATIATTNAAILQEFASYIISPAGTCFLLPLPPQKAITGIITQGSDNVFIGD